MSEKRKYRVMDCTRSMDLRTGEFVNSARTRVGGSHDGEIDYGHDCKSIYDYDNFGLLYVKQEPGVDSPYHDYVYHPGADEIELTLDGVAIMRYADGEGGPMTPGISTHIPAGLPHGNHHPGIDDVVLLVFYPKTVTDVSRADHKMGEPYTGGKKHTMVNFLEAPAEEVAPGHFVCNVHDGDGISMAYHRLAPGCTTSEADFLAHDTDEVIFVFRGTGVATYPDKTYPMRRDLAFYNPVGTPHRYMNTSTEDLHLIVLYACDSPASVKTEKKAFSVD